MSVWKIKTGKICDNCSFKERCKFKDFKVKPKYYYLSRAMDAHSFTLVHVVINVQKNGNIQILCLDEDKFNKYKSAIVMPHNNIGPLEFKDYRINCLIPSEHSLMRKYYPNSVYHERLHNYSTDNPYIKLIKEIGRYFYGEDGVKAVELHFELDELPHIIPSLKKLIPAYLSRGLYGKTSDRETRKYMNCSSFIRKYIFKNPQNILRSLKPSNIPRFKQNLVKLLQMTVGEFLGEYEVKYDGVLEDKKIGDLIQEYRDWFGELPKFIESLSNDLA